MKRSGSELGSLSSRLMAYAQMKKKDSVRTGEIAPILGITDSQERDLLRRLSASGWIVRLKRGVYLFPSRLPAGGKFSPGSGLILKKLMEEELGTYQVCGPNAFNLYGFDGQLPNVTYVYNDRISGNRSIGRLSFRFIKTSRERLGGTHRVRTAEGVDMVYSSRARTLMDAVYDWSRFDSLPRGYEWIRREIRARPRITPDLVDMTVRFGNLATARRIGYLLEELDRSARSTKPLQCCLTDSRSLIPWIPGKPARGSINRRWGIIVNE